MEVFILLIDRWPGYFTHSCKFDGFVKAVVPRVPGDFAERNRLLTTEGTEKKRYLVIGKTPAAFIPVHNSTLAIHNSLLSRAIKDKGEL